MVSDMAIGVAENPLTYPHREMNPYFAYIHLPPAPHSPKDFGEGANTYRETLDIALEADASAIEACLVFDHDRQLLRLNAAQRACVQDCLYALNRLIVEMQCALHRVSPLPPSGRHHLVAYLLLWRQIVAPCFALLGLPSCMRVDYSIARLHEWRPSQRSLSHLRLTYADAFRLAL